MSETNKETLWGMKPRNPSLGGDMMKIKVSKLVAILVMVLALIGLTLPAFAQTSFPSQPEHGCWGGAELPIAACEWPVGFSDVATSEYAAQAVEIARQAGIMVGNNNEDFQGERSLTRYEAAIIVARLLDFMAGGQISLNLDNWTTVSNAVVELEDVLVQFGLRLDFFEAYLKNYPTDAEWDAYRAELQSAIGDAYAMLEEHQVALIAAEESFSNEIRDIYLRLDEIEQRKLLENDAVALAKLEELRLELLDEITVSEALELRLDQSLGTIDGVLLGIARQIDELGLRQDDFERMLNQMRAENGDFVTTSTLDATLEGYVTTTTFEVDQARQDDEIAALWAAINALVNSGSADRITVTGDLGHDSPLAQPDCGLWFSATDNTNREITLATHRNYSGDMSVQFGRYADVNISSYQFPNGWNTGQEASQSGHKETRWYASALPTSATLTAVASYGNASCTVTWDVYHQGN